MRFTVQLPTHRVEEFDEFASGEAVGEMARAAEDAGFDACFVTDHPFPGDKWLAGGGHHALDPFVCLTWAAAATRTIRLHTHVLVLPYRNPFLTAKAAASLDALSGGRLILGVAAGYLKSEYRSLGADFEHRNALCDEAIVAIKRAWTEEGVELSGRAFEARGNTMLPRPVQKPHPPIWAGGNSRMAIRRAVELADGWAPFPNSQSVASYQRTAVMGSLEDLATGLAYAREHAEAVGRSAPLDVCFAPVGVDMFADAPPDPALLVEQVESLASVGVTWTALSLPARSRAAWCEAVAATGAALRAR
jgi:probable F420-dependent oxidoreductase